MPPQGAPDGTPEFSQGPLVTAVRTRCLRRPTVAWLVWSPSRSGCRRLPSVPVQWLRGVP